MREKDSRKSLWLLVATGLGLGYAPVASGTFGTLAGIPIVLALGSFCPWPFLLIATFCLLLVGVRAANIAEAHFGRQDAGEIVIDEIVGYMVTMFLIPVGLGTLVWAFFIFRFFDIAKPWPAGRIDRAEKGGWGVMLDDVAAGVYANIAMHLLLFAKVIPLPS